MDNNNIELGNKIKKLRLENKLTQKELAEKIGKTESSIRKYEKGLVSIPPDVIVNIANTFKINAYELIGEVFGDSADVIQKIQDEMFLNDCLKWLSEAISSSSDNWPTDDDIFISTDITTILSNLKFAYYNEIYGKEIIEDIARFSDNILYRYGFSPKTYNELSEEGE